MATEAKSKLSGIEQRPETVKPAESYKETAIAPLETRPQSVENAPEAAIPISAPSVSAPLAISGDPILSKVERILEEDLQEVYDGLPAELKPRFRAKGEEVAHAITALLEGAKVKARQILKLILQWLKMIPGVNRFFLEQAAAIKTQKVLMVEKDKGE